MSVVKVKEPIAPEYGFLRKDLTLFTYLHLAAAPALTQALLDAGTTAIAYETVQLPDRSLPLLAPMSEIAGRLSVQVGAQQLLGPAGGRGILLGGVPGTPRRSGAASTSVSTAVWTRGCRPVRPSPTSSPTPTS